MRFDSHRVSRECKGVSDAGARIPIEVGDIVGYARTVEEVIGRVENDIELLRKIVRDGAEFIRREYSPEAERESIVSCWNAIVGR